MLVKLTYGTDRVVGENWQQTEIYPAKRAAQEAVLLSAVLFQRELPEGNFAVGKDCQEAYIQSGCYFIEVETLEKEKQLCIFTK